MDQVEEGTVSCSDICHDGEAGLANHPDALVPVEPSSAPPATTWSAVAAVATALGAAAVL